MKKYNIERLNKSHDKAGFNCGEDSLNQYFYTQTSQDIKRSLTAIYVLSEGEQSAILGFYTLSASALSLIDLPEDISKRLPRYPSLPVTLLGRLAVDIHCQKQGLGEVLLIDALKRADLLSNDIGSMAVVVDALNKNAIHFYEKFGFTKFKNENKLFLTMKTIKKLNLC